MASPKDTKARRSKISTGPNARPVDSNVAQSGPGLPDDSSGPVEISPEEEKRIEEAIRRQR